jgi:hypothetical protein
MTGKVGDCFFANAAPAVHEMRNAGMSETLIATTLCDIRAAAIAEERLRVESIHRTSPPEYPTWVEMRDAIGDLIERRS